MENNDTMADYQELARVGNQSWDMVKITIGTIFLFEIHIHYFLYIQGIFKSHLQKLTPTQSANSHPKPQFDLNLYYKNLLKNGSPPPPPLNHPGNANYEILKNI